MRSLTFSFSYVSRGNGFSWITFLTGSGSYLSMNRGLSFCVEKDATMLITLLVLLLIIFFFFNLVLLFIKKLMRHSSQFVMSDEKEEASSAAKVRGVFDSRRNQVTDPIVP